jgi:transcriptional repressor NrdR
LRVTDSRDANEANAIRRRRECCDCSRRFTTFETIEMAPLQVRKRDGRYQDFDAEKLLHGIVKACRHTHISREQALSIAHKISSELLQNSISSVTSKEIGDRVMDELKALDSIAYIRFACEYRRFKDVDELMDAIRCIQPKDAG